MQKLILGMTLVMAAGFGQAAFGDNDKDKGAKVIVCHKGERTVSISASGLNGHLNHGDTEGSCESRQAAVVIMQCAAEGDGIEVVAVSASPYVPVDLIPEDGDDCATALADLLDARMRVDAVTPGSDGVTNYLVTGYVAVPAS